MAEPHATRRGSHGWWRRWLDARSPPCDECTLTQRNVYIVPSRGGWGYALVTLGLLLAAINEQLNLAYALAFLLGGVGLTAMWSTHMNLRDLRLSLGTVASVPAGQALQVPVRLDALRAQGGRFGLTLQWHDLLRRGRPVEAEVAEGAQTLWELALPTSVRGAMKLPRLRVETQYPLGLFKAWAYWQPAREVWVWPAPELHAPPREDPGSDQGAEPSLRMANQDPLSGDDLRPWKAGDGHRAVVWKKSVIALMNGQSPVVRSERATARHDVWVDWQATQGLATEARLSRLAAWLLAQEHRAGEEAAGARYGLRMPGVCLGPDRGPVFMASCMDALARWERP